MTKLSTRQKEIEQLEGFKIQIFDGKGQLVDPDTQGLPQYLYQRKAAGTMTVVEWKASRFSTSYPGYTCDVLEANGEVAHGNFKLQNKNIRP